jgi:hypothetical protein
LLLYLPYIIDINVELAHGLSSELEPSGFRRV